MSFDNFKSRLLSEGFKPTGATPNKRQIEWYEREKMIFFHFGINTFTGREWGDGTEDPKLFNPTELDCRQWIKTIKDAGFTTAILTAKHHDGFCLWPSAYTEHSVKNSSYKNGKGDIVREFTDACREFGVKAGIYLSPWDRHEKCWGTDAYNDYYDAQLRELLTNYGEIWECWWDGAGSTETTYDWERWAGTIRTLQPNATIFGSLGASKLVDSRWVGNESGFAGKPCWSSIDYESLMGECQRELNSGKLGGNSFIPAETDVSIRPGWFYHAEQDENVRTPANLFELWLLSVGRNTTLLLNLPPNTKGLVSEADAKSLAEFSAVLSKGLSNNLALGASVKASSTRSEAYRAENTLDPNPESFFAAADGDKSPELVFSFGKDIEFNAIELGELMELGHRVTKFEASALIGGKWKKLYENECMGFRSVERFKTVKASAVKVVIKEFLDTPLIKKLAIYRFDELKESVLAIPKEKKNLVCGASAAVSREGDAFDINFGGIFPFDTVIIKGARAFEIEVFNGTSFENMASCIETDIYKFFKPIRHSYRVRLTVTERESENAELIPEIY